MRNTTVKKTFLFLSLFVLMTSACNMTVSVAPSTSPASTQQSEPATPTSEIFISLTQAVPSQVQPTVVPNPTTTPASIAGTAITFSPLSFVLPSGVASGASGGDYPRIDSDDAAEWQKTPGHLQVMLGDYYILQGKTHQPQIYVYPAQDYAELVPTAFESIRRVNNLIYGSGGPISPDQLPAVPFFNAQQVFAANIQVLSFQNGSGVRFLTEYAQYPASANNQDLFYTFQGVTRDGAYYIVAIFPVSVPVLAETSDPGAILPSGGVPYPYYADPNADMTGYYQAITALLNAQTPDVFTPNLTQLDALIQSMQVNP